MVIDGRKKKDFSDKILAETVFTMVLIYDKKLRYEDFEKCFGVGLRTMRRYAADIRESGFGAKIVFRKKSVSVAFNENAWWFWEFTKVKTEDPHIERLNRIFLILNEFMDQYNGYIGFPKRCGWYERFYGYDGDDEAYLSDWDEDDFYDDEGNYIEPEVSFPLEPGRVTAGKVLKSFGNGRAGFNVCRRTVDRDLKVLEKATEVYRENFLQKSPD